VARSLWNLVRCSHPEPVAAVTLAVGILCLAAGRGWSTGWAMAAVLAGQLCVGWTNDYLDRDLDRRAGRTDKPIVAGLVPAGRVRNAALVALAVCVPLSLANGIAAGALHLAGVGLASAYNLRLKSTPASVLAYAIGFGLIPAFVTLGLHPGHLPPAWVTLAAALLGAGGHFTQVLPDFEDDRRLGLRGMPQLLGVTGSTVAAGLLLAGSALAILLGPGHPGELQLVALGVTLALVPGIVISGLSGRSRLAFRLTLVAAGAIAVMLLAGSRALA
jgi:4-hydroxybenzoate polyprenyltransferase